MMDGRVKTLHPKIHGGILGRRGIDDKVMQEYGIGPIDLSCHQSYIHLPQRLQNLIAL